MTDEGDAATVPVICEACETTSRVPMEDVADVVARHNDGLHDGEDRAQVDPEVVDHLTDLVAEDLGLLEDTQ